MLRRFERAGPDVRSLPELVKQLEHNQDTVRLLAIKLRAAGPNAKDAIPALERMREDPSAEVRKQWAGCQRSNKEQRGIEPGKRRRPQDGGERSDWSPID